MIGGSGDNATIVVQSPGGSGRMIRVKTRGDGVVGVKREDFAVVGVMGGDIAMGGVKEGNGMLQAVPVTGSRTCL